MGRLIALTEGELTANGSGMMVKDMDMAGHESTGAGESETDHGGEATDDGGAAADVAAAAVGGIVVAASGDAAEDVAHPAKSSMMTDDSLNEVYRASTVTVGPSLQACRTHRTLALPHQSGALVALQHSRGHMSLQVAPSGLGRY